MCRQRIRIRPSESSIAVDKFGQIANAQLDVHGEVEHRVNETDQAAPDNGFRAIYLTLFGQVTR